MLDVVFSHSYYYKFDPKQWNNKTPYPPLGTLYAASYLRENGYKVGVFDANLLDNPQAVQPYLEAQKPKTFVLYDDGFNYLTKMCLTTMRDAAFEMIKIAKQLNCKVIVCSSDSTDHYEKYLNAGADFIIQGEGEIALKELVDALENNTNTSEIKGLVFYQNGSIKKNPQRPVLRDLDELPIPAWDLIDINAYKAIWTSGGNKFTLNIATTRGCPFKCNWCAKPIYGNRYNSHSPKYITKHIKYLSETYGVNRFWMCDDIFGLKPNWVQDFNKELKKEELSISYYIQSRVDLLLKEDTIDALAESGLEEVWVGAESGSQAILDAMDKDTTIEQIYEATRLLKEKNVRVAFFIQFGYLGETKEDISKTIAMIKELVPDNIGVSVSYPLPGTKFYDKVKDDLKLKANWTDSDDLAMLFKGTYSSAFYKKLQRYVHKEYRKSQAFENLKNGIKHPFKLSKQQLRSIVLLGYYLPSAFLDKLQLKNMELSNG
ncbi:B12-binding domain-containing radical SAM protein [Winogradskyella echinorum]|uniref:B12-binding domain-containing radical SAM protein n=1 Tax=Winogradskyella echinorum TaxID=538189 RepID=A0ABR6XYL3_9FLAO|nr:radical SAM protein [Winogradskyella echinorum]MBC3845567.1 B12-binding domain-containing radical SAM protein [Winogradskyella echinorum]MBC5749915.1 B12-binding domain-containing radical SAM protein [Winogradskyella echinorum]